MHSLPAQQRLLHTVLRRRARGATCSSARRLLTYSALKFLCPFLTLQCKKHNVDCSPPQTTARLLDKLVGEFIESQVSIEILGIVAQLIIAGLKQFVCWTTWWGSSLRAR